MFLHVQGRSKDTLKRMWLEIFRWALHFRMKVEPVQPTKCIRILKETLPRESQRWNHNKVHSTPTSPQRQHWYQARKFPKSKSIFCCPSAFIPVLKPLMIRYSSWQAVEEDWGEFFLSFHVRYAIWSRPNLRKISFSFKWQLSFDCCLRLYL